MINIEEARELVAGALGRSGCWIRETDLPGEIFITTSISEISNFDLANELTERQVKNLISRVHTNLDLEKNCGLGYDEDGTVWASPRGYKRLIVAIRGEGVAA
ncbi:MAG: hypothetical protein Q8P61_02165 [Candidatus Nanopelagicales bacterium]|nr:hypothetical protein [Candidatus Nanopelagicales bacterium]